MEKEQSEVTVENISQEEKITVETIKSNNDMKSKKFIAYLVSIIVGLVCFIVIFVQSRDVSSFQKYLDFLLYALITYIGGNSMERLTDKMGKK